MNTEQVLDTLIEALKEKKGKDKIIFSLFQLKKFIALVEAAEREACAKICESLITEGDPYPANFVLKTCAKTIRARNE
jgi:hypothetical protein